MAEKKSRYYCVANLGDVDWIDHGGHFVLVDLAGRTGARSIELQVLGTEKPEWDVYDYTIPQCTYGRMVDGVWQRLEEYHPDGILSDNSFHPEIAAWFATPESRKAVRPQDTTYLSRAASCSGMADLWSLIELFVSADPITRALGYKFIGEYHGFNNFDAYPSRYSFKLAVLQAHRKYERMAQQWQAGSK